MSVKLSIQGEQRFRRALFEMEQEHPWAVRAAMFAVSQRLGEKIYPKIPEDTGWLRSTFGITPPVGGRDIIIGVGAEYGLYVHERTDLYHEPPTQAKFIESVWNRNRQWLVHNVGKLSKEYLKVKRMNWTKVPARFPTVIRAG